MNHIVLLGDSVFDNGAYVGAGLDVRNQLRQRLSTDWNVTLLAKDGSTTDDIASQIKNLPKTATHLVLSVGGNDAILQMGVLDTSVKSVLEAIALMTNVSADFSRRYESMLQTLLKQLLPLTLCTIYTPFLSEPTLKKAASVALALYNDCILRAAVTNHLSVLDLRFVCIQAADFSHEIEPSAAGGAKIAEVIQRHLTENAVSNTQIFI